MLNKVVNVIFLVRFLNKLVYDIIPLIGLTIIKNCIIFHESCFVLKLVYNCDIKFSEK